MKKKKYEIVRQVVLEPVIKPSQQISETVFLKRRKKQ